MNYYNDKYRVVLQKTKRLRDRVLGYSIISCVIGATILSLFDKEGWGWLLLLAIVILLEISYSRGH